jgi:hypothetical protein
MVCTYALNHSQTELCQNAWIKKAKFFTQVVRKIHTTGLYITDSICRKCVISSINISLLSLVTPTDMKSSVA